MTKRRLHQDWTSGEGAVDGSLGGSDVGVDVGLDVGSSGVTTIRT